MNQPSFQPWYARVRMIRLWFAIVTFLVVASVARSNGLEWDQALMRAVAGSVIAFFMGWASSLWLFSELYQLEIRRLEQRMREREQERARQMEEMTRNRMQSMAGRPPRGGADAAPPDGREVA